jgi:uncharacterized Rmd1/YagE family protein
VVSTAPLAFKYEQDGLVVVFRYGVVVLIGLSPEGETEILNNISWRLVRPVEPHEEEVAYVEIASDREDQILPGGPILLRAIEPAHLIMVADALSKSVVLARDEREVSAVFEQIEPFVRQLADKGRTAAGRTVILKHIGNALLVQQRVSGRVAAGEKPDVVWDRPDLERLFSRLQDEYELPERVESLSRKLTVIAETAELLTDIIDTKRSLRLEIVIVVLIAVELILAVIRW